ncbi:hypothetical protein [Chitinimonas lacunae]|uniref:KH domain-containing protein n=1 Tax=Chitinimonas lacunae TaxID=1963018 RepID=A0ABV8MQV5_9NEIS
MVTSVNAVRGAAGARPAEILAGLAALADAYSLSWNTALKLLQDSVEKLYLQQGRRVRCVFDPDAEPSLYGLEQRPGGEVRLNDLLQPRLAWLRHRIEEYLDSEAERAGWPLAVVEVLARHEDHLLLKVLESEQFADGETAILPYSHLAALDREQVLQVGANFYALLRPRPLAVVGKESWHTTQAPWLASRLDALFLKKLFYRMVPMDCRVDIAGGVGLIVIPTGADMGRCIGPKGEYAKTLRLQAGLKRIHFAREVPGRCSSPTHRVRFAISQISGHGRFRCVDGENGVVRVFVPPANAAEIIGADGVNLRFTHFLSGQQITVTSTGYKEDQVDKPLDVSERLAAVRS